MYYFLKYSCIIAKNLPERDGVFPGHVTTILHLEQDVLFDICMQFNLRIQFMILLQELTWDSR